MKTLCIWSILLLGAWNCAAQQDSLPSAADTASVYPNYDYSYYDTPTKQPVDERLYWHGFLAPGGGYTGYRPLRADSLGWFHGPFFKWIFFHRAIEAERGPGRIQTYFQINLLRGTRPLSEQPRLLSYAFGFNFSFESNVKRRFCIPYFGLELGGMHQGGGRRYGTFHLTPTVGLHVVALRRIHGFIELGYVFATHRFDQWSGALARAGINVQFW